MSLFHLGLGGALPVLAATLLIGQTAPIGQFEVASVKPAQPLTPDLVHSPAFHVGTKISGTRVDIGRMRLIDLIAQAYGVRQNRVVGPSWLKTTQDLFDIDARMPADSTTQQMPHMLRALLAERFQLAAHKETREFAGYALVASKDGAKLTPAEPEPELPVASAAPQTTPSLNGRGGSAPKQTFSDSADGKTTRYVNPRVDMARLAAMLEPLLDQPVSDMTGLAGYYTIALDISMADMRRMLGVPMGFGGSGPGAGPAELAAEPAGRSVIASLRAMGLHLEPRRVPVEVVVVDRLEPRPAAN